MRIEIVEVGQVTKEKTFFVLPVKYKSDGKTQDKKIFSFNDNAYKALKDAKAEQIFDVKLQKDKNGYWQWDEVTPSTGGSSTSNSASSSVGRTNTYETPEERARRQILIVRQSCLAQAINMKGVGEENIENVLDTAEAFEEWVNRE